MEINAWIGLGTLIIMLLLIVSSVPIWFSLAVAAFIGFWLVGGPIYTFEQFGSATYYITSSFTFAVIPLFILMSLLAAESGIAEACFETFDKWIGRMRGGLLISTILGSSVFGACSGMSLAATAVFAKIALPELEKRKYDISLGSACVALAGTLDNFIPPSVPIVIYCILLNLSIGKALVAGIGPGIVLAILLCLVVIVTGIIKPSLMPSAKERVSWKEKFLSLRLTGPILLVIFVMIGGIYLGIFAPTVGGAIGSALLLIIALIRRVKIKKVVDSFTETVLINAQIYPVVIAGFLYSRFISLSGLPSNFAELIASANLSPALLLLCVVIFYIIVGCVLDYMSMLIVTLPLLFPILVSSGFHPLVCMVCILLLGGVASITPPVGMAVFIVSGVANIKPEVVFRGIVPYFVVCLLFVWLLAFVPQITIWLPELFYR